MNKDILAKCNFLCFEVNYLSISRGGPRPPPSGFANALNFHLYKLQFNIMTMITYLLIVRYFDF